MDKNENCIYNLIYSENIKEHKIFPLEKIEDTDKFLSITECLKNINTNNINSSIDENKENKEQSSNKKDICINKNNSKFLNNNYNSNIYQTKTYKDYNACKLNNAINNVNLKLDYSLNSNIESIKINRKNKNIINSKTEHNSIVLNKHTHKINPSLKKNQKSIDNTYLNRKIQIYSDRNKPQIKMIPNSTDFNKNINLNIYNNIKTKKRIISSLKIKSKGKAPKLNQDISSDNYNKCPKNKIKKRYNSVQPSSPKNQSLKVNKKIDETSVLGINKKIKKSFSFKKNLKDSKNNSFLNYNMKNNNKISAKSQMMEEKIKELEFETFKFREERNKVNELKLQYEKLQSKLFNDIEDFSKKKEEFEKFKQNEINNINKERKNMFIDNKFINNLKNQNKSLEVEIKKNEEEISQLKMKIEELKLIIKNKDVEIKNLQKIINDKNSCKKIPPVQKLKDIENDNENINTLGNLNKKNNSVKIFNNVEKNYSLCNPKALKVKKINITNNNKNKNIILSNNNSIIEQKDSSHIFKKYKFNNKENNNDESKISINSNQINNKSLIYNPGFKRKINMDNCSCYSMNIRQDSDYNSNIFSNINNSKIEPIKNSTLNNNNYTIKNYQNKNKTLSIKNNFIYPIQCKLKKNSSKKIYEFINKKINKKNYKTNISDNEKINKESLDINEDIQSIQSELATSNNQENNNNNNYDFIIPEKYIEKNNNNQIVKILNLNGNNIAFYSNNKKEITYPDGKKQVIFDDNHQIIYYNNGDIKQIFNNGKTVFFNFNDGKVETLYENGIKIVKYKNGRMERFFNEFNEDKENLHNNIISQSNFNSINNDDKIKNEFNKKLSKKYIYHNKCKTIIK